MICKQSIGILIWFLITLLPVAEAQDQHRIDSLQHAIKNTGYDTARVNTMLQFASAFRNSKPKSAMLYTRDALKLANSLKEKKIISKCLNFMGLLYDDAGDFEKALEYYQKSLEIRKEIDNKKGIASCYTNLGVLYLHNSGDVKTALDYYFKAMTIYEELNYDKGLSKSLNNIGVLYKAKGDYEKALEYYLKAQKILVRLHDEKEIARGLSNIGNIYYAEEFFDKALESYNKSLKIRKPLNDLSGIANCYNNIAAIYYHRGSLSQALDYSFKALDIYKELGNPSDIVRALNNIGSLYEKQGNYEKAEDYCLRSLEMAKEYKNREGVKDVYEALTNIYEAQGEFQKAIEIYKKYSEVKDSIAVETNKANIAEMAAEHEAEKQQKEIEILQKEKAIQEMKLNRNKLLIYAISAGFALLLILALVVLRGYRQKKAANQKLEYQNEEIGKQKAVIEEKNNNITDSIEYAKRIQYAVLPPVESIKRFLRDYFVIFIPRDIVSGDFYWIERNKDKIFIAAVDCTGHGVPGAFMSFLGYNHLNQAVREERLTKPSEILNSLNEAVRDSLHQRNIDNDVNDGMDIALCSIDTERRILGFSGANNPLYYFTGPEEKKELFVIKGDSKAIGGAQSEGQTSFHNHEIGLLQGDSFYIFSDGLTDQFGGPFGKKFKSRQLRDILVKIQQEPMAVQKDILMKSFMDWKGDLEQVDDICLIGVRV